MRRPAFALGVLALGLAVSTAAQVPYRMQLTLPAAPENVITFPGTSATPYQGSLILRFLPTSIPDYYDVQLEELRIFVSELEILGESTGELVVSLDTPNPSFGTYDAASGAFSISTYTDLVYGALIDYPDYVEVGFWLDENANPLTGYPLLLPVTSRVSFTGTLDPALLAWDGSVSLEILDPAAPLFSDLLPAGPTGTGGSSGAGSDAARQWSAKRVGLEAYILKNTKKADDSAFARADAVAAVARVRELYRKCCVFVEPVVYIEDYVVPGVNEGTTEPQDLDDDQIEAIVRHAGARGDARGKARLFFASSHEEDNPGIAFVTHNRSNVWSGAFVFTRDDHGYAGNIAGHELGHHVGGCRDIYTAATRKGNVSVYSICQKIADGALTMDDVHERQKLMFGIAHIRCIIDGVTHEKTLKVDLMTEDICQCLRTGGSQVPRSDDLPGGYLADDSRECQCNPDKPDECKVQRERRRLRSSDGPSGPDEVIYATMLRDGSEMAGVVTRFEIVAGDGVLSADFGGAVGADARRAIVTTDSRGQVRVGLSPAGSPFALLRVVMASGFDDDPVPVGYCFVPFSQ